MVRKANNERHRILRITAKKSAQLPVPLLNQVLGELIADGKLREKRRFLEIWGGKSHECVELEITKAGLEELLSYETELEREKE